MNQISPFIEKTIYKLNHTESINEFWEDVQSHEYPIWENSRNNQESLLVTFLYKGNSSTKNVALISPLIMDQSDDLFFSNIEGTDIWYKTIEVQPNTLSIYFYSVNDDFGEDWMAREKNLIPDLLNCQQFHFFANPNEPDDKDQICSVISQNHQCFENKHREIPKGKVERKEVYSQVLNSNRCIWVYTPSGYSDEKRYPVLTIFDGFTYMKSLNIPELLDYWIHNLDIPPIVVVFVDNPLQVRNKELPCNPTFAEFVSEELLPIIQHTYSIYKDPRYSIIAGSSFGGLAATFTAFYYPEVFGNVISQSGSYWWKDPSNNELIFSLFNESEKKSIDFYLDIGIYEKKESMIQTNRSFYELLRKKGYHVTYHEFAGGHDYINWKYTILDGLHALLCEKNEQIGGNYDN